MLSGDPIFHYQPICGRDAGRVLRRGIDTTIVGSPNVGKSTLMNLLSGCERSIVTDIAVTTLFNN